MRRAALAALVAALVVAVTACGPTVRPTGAPSGKTPVIFVHGYTESPSMWDTAAAAFKAAGYTAGDITEFSYDSNLAASTVATQLAAEVDHLRQFTGKAKVDIVSHSYGAMVSRYCIELGSCQGKVSHWMSLAGADNGTSIANLCAFFADSCKDMSGQTNTITQLQANWSQITTQGIKVEVQWTTNDGVIIPATASKELAPATNVEVSSSLNHLNIFTDAGVIAETIRFFTT